MDDDLENEWETIKSELYNGGCQWRNIQEPIVQTFDAVSRGLRNTHIKMYDMDSKLTTMATETDRQMAAFNTNILRLNTQLERLTTVVEVQNEGIGDMRLNFDGLSKRVDEIALVLDASRLKQSDKLYMHLQEQIKAMATESVDMGKACQRSMERTAELERKLAFKANQREVDDVVPFKIEEAARKLQSQLNDLRHELGACATKEEFANLSNNKATVHDLRTLAIEATEKVNRVEMADALNDQIRPVVSAIASLEKAIQYIEQGSKACKEDVEVLRPICAAAAASADAARSGVQHMVRMDESQVVTIVETLLREKQLDVTALGLQNSLAEYREVLLKDVSTFLESTKLEVRTGNNEKSESLRMAVDKRMLELAVAVKDAKDSSGRTKNGVKELANNVAKALSGKADRDELKKFVTEQAEHDATATAASTAAAVSAASALVYGTGTPLHQSGSELLELASLPVRGGDKSGRALYGTGSHGHSHGHSGHNGSHGLSHSGHGIGSSAPLGERINRIMYDYSAMRGDVDTMDKSNKQVRAEMIHMQRMVSNLRDVVDKKVSVEDITTGAVSVAGTSVTGGGRSKKGHGSDKSGLPGSDEEGGGAEWRTVVGDLQSSLRKSVDSMVSKEELTSAVARETTALTGKLSNMQCEISTALTLATEGINHEAVDDVREKVENLEKMQRQLALDLVSGGRWLWSSGQREADGWIPWDVEVQNSASATMLWTAGSYSIRARVPGLYKICVAVFTTKPLALQVCLNWEPLLSLQPPGGSDGSGSPSAEGRVVQGQGHVIRATHPAGEVTCVTIDEYISLPAESVLAVRFHAGAPAQAMLTLKKL